MKRLLQLLALKMETNFLEFLTHLFFEGEKKNLVKIKTLFSLQNSLWLTLQIEKYCGVDDFVTVLLVDIMVGSVFAIVLMVSSLLIFIILIGRMKPNSQVRNVFQMFLAKQCFSKYGG